MQIFSDFSHLTPCLRFYITGLRNGASGHSGRVFEPVVDFVPSYLILSLLSNLSYLTFRHALGFTVLGSGIALLDTEVASSSLLWILFIPILSHLSYLFLIFTFRHAFGSTVLGSGIALLDTVVAFSSLLWILWISAMICNWRSATVVMVVTSSVVEQSRNISHRKSINEMSRSNLT